MEAQAARFEAPFAGMTNVDEGDRRFQTAEHLLREIGFAFYLGATLLEHAEYLNSHGHGNPAELAAEAHSIFEHLRASPWLDRAEALLPEAAVTS
jgi:hypothetical protein